MHLHATQRDAPARAEVNPDHGRANAVGIVSAFVFAGLIGSMALF